MRKLLNSLVFLVLFSISAGATGDSLSYLTPKDTIFLKVDDFGNKIFCHQMEKGQTLYSLARFYGLKVNALLAYNSHVNPEIGFVPGTPVNIPIPDSAFIKTWEHGYPKAGFVPVVYVVKHGDTFYRIAKHYFNIPLDTLQFWNGLKETKMYTGMKLHVGFMPLDGIPDSLQRANYNPIGTKMQQLQWKFEQRKSIDAPSFQNGAAYWQREKRGRSDYYCLHRTAPVGSVIQIKNPMRHKTVYAKVLAPIPDRAYGDDIIVVLSPTIAKLLGARDPKFYVELKYF
ncbi:MAG TPA: LysM peptidoglycan-binding domain-containing protein [Bacteroidetes bacterium]|nr:LysM peptidoglycan-binding domain-containing protein [Bacteroidota bacterium]